VYINMILIGLFVCRLYIAVYVSCRVMSEKMSVIESPNLIYMIMLMQPGMNMI